MRSLTERFARCGITGAFALALLVGGSTAAQAQGYRPYSYGPPSSRMGSPVDVTTQHLEMLAHRNGSFDSWRERQRYDNAIRHLSDFQSRLYRGYFDKGKLDQAIGDVQNVVNHNALDERGRRILWTDLNNLRTFRAARGQGEYIR
jgi:hypothetical protein